jgi:spermidine synthase
MSLGIGTTVVLIAAAAVVQRGGDLLENRLYQAPIIAREQSKHQRIVLTRHRGDVRLFLDGDLQFSSIDEHRYHEALVHPALSLHPAPRRVLLLGAGDGLALREVLAHATVREAILIDLDASVVRLARRHPALKRLNRGSLDDPRCR